MFNLNRMKYKGADFSFAGKVKKEDNVNLLQQ